MDYKHIIWDFDGTLFDTYPHTARAFQITLKKYWGLSESAGEIIEQLRVSDEHAYDYYRYKYDIDDEFIKMFEDYRVLYENLNVTPYLNTHMLCKFIREQGGVNYLLTERDDAVLSIMQKHGFYELFADIVTQINSSEGLIYLMGRHRLRKDEILFVADSKADLKAAKLSGVSFCYFTEDINKRADNADYNIQNFSDLFYVINKSLSTRKGKNDA